MSQKGVDFIADHEGFRADYYEDAVVSNLLKDISMGLVIDGGNRAFEPSATATPARRKTNVPTPVPLPGSVAKNYS